MTVLQLSIALLLLLLVLVLLLLLLLQVLELLLLLLLLLRVMLVGVIQAGGRMGDHARRGVERVHSRRRVGIGEYGVLRSPTARHRHRSLIGRA